MFIKLFGNWNEERWKNAVSHVKKVEPDLLDKWSPDKRKKHSQLWRRFAGEILKAIPVPTVIHPRQDADDDTDNVSDTDESNCHRENCTVYFAYVIKIVDSHLGLL
jgi:hypothetical protein